MEINATLFIQLFIFLSLLLILSNFLFAPLLLLLDKRDFLLKEVKASAINLRLETEKIKLDCEEKLQKARLEAKKELSLLKNAADIQAGEIINQAKEKITNGLKDHEKSLQNQENALQKNMDNMSDEISLIIVNLLKTRKLG